MAREMSAWSRAGFAGGSSGAAWFAAALTLSSLAIGCGPGDNGTDAAITPDAAPVNCSTGDVTGGRAATARRACTSCHGADLGGATSGTPGPNLTTLDDWSDQEITRAILDGVDEDGSPLCASMTRFRAIGVDATEACNIVAYLRSLDAVARDVPDTCD